VGKKKDPSQEVRVHAFITKKNETLISSRSIISLAFHGGVKEIPFIDCFVSQDMVATSAIRGKY
jgi:hypothetical protein